MTFDLRELPKLLTDLYAIVARLEELAPGRKFTPDGHLVGSIGEAVAAFAYQLELLPASVKQHDAKASDGRLVQIKLTQGQSVALSYDCEHLLVLQLDQRRGFVEVYNGPGAPVWERIEAKKGIGQQRQIRLSTLCSIASTGSNRALPQVQPLPDILPKALEAAGVEFIAQDGEEPGARLR
jgi:YD repeat-containing protein